MDLKEGNCNETGKEPKAPQEVSDSHKSCNTPLLEPQCNNEHDHPSNEKSNLESEKPRNCVIMREMKTMQMITAVQSFHISSSCVQVQSTICNEILLAYKFRQIYEFA